MSAHVLLIAALILAPLVVVAIIVFPDRVGRRNWRKP